MKSFMIVGEPLGLVGEYVFVYDSMKTIVVFVGTW